MNIEIWCKSFLSIYQIIPQLISSIDKLVYLKGVNSSNFVNNPNNETFNQLDSIINLTQKKVNLINLKIITDQVLLEMDEKNSKLLMFRYIDNMKCKTAQALLNMPKRSYFRALSKALKDFELRFYSKVAKNNTLYSNFSTDEFFDNIFQKINEFEEKISENSEIISTTLCNIILKQMKKTF